MYSFPGSLQAGWPGNRLTEFLTFGSFNRRCSSLTVIAMVRVSEARLFPMTAMDWTFFIWPFLGSDTMQQPAVHITFGILMLFVAGIPFLVEVYVIFLLGRKPS